jgi:hypothetical protein
MSYTITHALANGLTANLSLARAGQYAVYDPAGRFLTYVKSIKAAHQYANNFVGRRVAG